jgi:hypothetical protein
MIYAQGTPDFEKLCAKGDKLYEKGSYAEALKLYKQCLPYCKNCNDEIRGNRVLYCINRLKKPEWQVPPSVKSPNTPKYMVLIEPMVNPGDTIKEYEEVAKMPVELRDTTIIYRTIEKTKTDTLFITDNSNLIHPYFFIKSWTVEKKTWRWVFNGVGVVIGIGGGVGFGIAANNNYENHINNIALTKTKHSQYYSNYKLYSGLMWGCIGVGVVALSSNLFCSPVKDKVTISPGIYADPQGNMGMSVKIKF